MRLISLLLLLFFPFVFQFACGLVHSRDDDIAFNIREDADLGNNHGDASDGTVSGGNDYENTAITPCTSDCPDLDWAMIPGGTFTIGIDDLFDYSGQKITVPTFLMLRNEVTVSQYAQCVSVGACSEPEYSTDDSYNWNTPGRENHPINQVNWHQAKAFAQWVGARLPSEAEWEYAARSGGQDILYPWGDEEATCEYAVIDESGQYETGCDDMGTTMEVCTKPSGNTEQGLCDMAGNVEEWTEDDWHQEYDGSPADGRAWVDKPRTKARVVRGGSWIDIARRCRSGYRSWRFANVYNNDVTGFRIARDL